MKATSYGGKAVRYSKNCQQLSFRAEAATVRAVVLMRHVIFNGTAVSARLQVDQSTVKHGIWA